MEAQTLCAFIRARISTKRNQHMQPIRISLVQISASSDPGENLDRVQRLIHDAAPCDLIALPEVFAMRGDREDYLAHAETIPGPTTAWLAELAASRNAWVLGGSCIERAGERVFNTSILVNRQGQVTATYRKIHLFEATLDTGEVICEADTYTPGDTPVMAELEGWRCGLSICYDLRFPELYRHYSAAGAHLLLVPADFTRRTGKDHWEPLLRARAIENQCFVIAPCQCGANARSGVVSHGHTMVIDPWGQVLADAGTEEGYVTATLDPEHLQTVRKRIPVRKHRRL